MSQTKRFSRIDAHAFHVDVVVEIIPGDAECDAPPLEASRREISVPYRRDGAGSRYAAGSDALERLAIENQGRF